MRGSNGWAIAPSRSASGNALLLANPHLPWGDLFTWYEAHLVLPDMDAYGATLVGFPLPGIAFNAQLGWTHTVNTIDAADLYELTLRDDGYVWDGRVRALEADTVVLHVRTAEGAVRGEPLVVQRSLHGPIVARSGARAVALRVAGLDRPNMFEQNLLMLRARDIGQFEAALSRLQLPMFTVIYADRDGHILHVFNGSVPVRFRGDWRTWSRVVRGDSSSMLWTQIHDYADLPRVVDPPSGWLQNANDPPWTTTFPPALRPDHFAPYMAPAIPLQFRPQRSARMLAEDSLVTFDELVTYKHSTYVEAADHVIEDIVIAARAHGGNAARRAAQVLAAWDRQTEPESRGAILFEAYWREMSRQRWSSGSPFDVRWQVGSPFSTPDGLSDPATAASILEAVATQVESTYGALDVAWGEVHRLRAEGMDLPANGGPGGIGVFRVVGFSRAPDGRRVASSGDSFVAAIEFGEQVRAATIIPYGNATQPHSAHRFDQLPLFARSRLRPVWFTRADIERNMERRETY
jgi:acyl-homoserine-lactone acylase